MLPKYLKLACLFCWILPNQCLHSTPLFSVETQIGDQNPLFVEALLPFNRVGNHYFFANAQASYSFNIRNGNAQTGFLYRYLHQEHLALGGYVYTAYNRSPYGPYFWTINSGLEFMTPRWHLNLNSYLPAGGTQKKSGPIYFASNLGYDQYAYFQQHSEYDAVLQQRASTGTGADLVLSYKIKPLHDSRVSLGGYYFNFPHAPVGGKAILPGVSTGITTPSFHGFSGRLAYNYDSLNQNVVTLGIRYRMDESSSQTDNWLEQSTQHNIATLGQANSVPFERGFLPIAYNQLLHDNLWFFAPNSSSSSFIHTSSSSINLNNCTFEQPCTNLSSETAAHIAIVSQDQSFRDAPSLYLSPGNYQTSDHLLQLFGNESINGRSKNYLHAAALDERPVLSLYGIVIQGANGNHTNTLANVQLFNTGGATDAAVVVNNTQNILIDNLLIGAMDTKQINTNYSQGLVLNNVQNTRIVNTTINANNLLYNPTNYLSGISLYGTTNLYLNNTQVNSTTYDPLAITMAISVFGESKLQINNSSLNANTSVQNPLDSASVFGIWVSEDGGAINFDIIGSHINASALGNAAAINLLLLNASSGTINQSILTAGVSNTGDTSGSFNLLMRDDSRVMVKNSSFFIDSSSTQGRAGGNNFQLGDKAAAFIEDSTLVATGNTYTIDGNTNITTANYARVDVTNSDLICSLNAQLGPSVPGLESAGAVTIWAFDHSSINIDHSYLAAISGSAYTQSVILEAETAATVTINNSVLHRSATNGNLLLPNEYTNSAILASGAGTTVNLFRSTIYSEDAGLTVNSVSALTAIESAHITMGSSIIIEKNSAKSLASGNYTIAASAAQPGSVITLSDTLSILFADNVKLYENLSGGQVIVNNAHGVIIPFSA